MKRLLLIFGFLVTWVFSTAQYNNKAGLEIYLDQSFSNLSWSNFVEKIEKNYAVHFYIQFVDIPEIQISFNTDSLTLKKVLRDHLLPFNIFASFDKKGNIFINKNSVISTQLSPSFFKVSREDEVKQEDIITENIIDKNYIQTSDKLIGQTLIIGSKEKGVNKSTAIIQGKIITNIGKQVVENATIIDLYSGKGVLTDAVGNYKIELNIGKHILEISSVNIVEKQVNIDLQSSGTLDLVMDEKIILLKDVIIRDERDNKVIGTQMGLDKVITKNVKKIPLVFGEKDIVKVATLLPGVQTVGEGTSGFNVRGSPTDQNLFYINHLPIYNTSHLSGFFSAFNADVIDEFSLYKSNIPIEFGGRLSSVFEIKTKTGNKDKVTARGGIGPITSRLTVEGPLKKEKNSFLVGIRSTYSDWVLNFIEDPIVKNSKAYFGDAVTNFSFQLDDNNQLNVFSYFSTDKMDLHTQSKYNYQNYGGSINWKHFFKNQNSFELSFAYSGYQFAEENEQLEIASYIHNNQLSHTEFKTIFNIIPLENHWLKFGINSILYNIDKGSYSPISNASYIIPTILGKEKGIENGLFLSDEWKINPKLTLSGGIRYNLYTYVGEQDVNIYEAGMPLTGGNLIDVLHFNNWEPIKTYGGLDYRFAVNQLLSENLSIKAAYNRLHQFIYMLSNTIAVSPNYRWKLSDYNTKPIVGDQLTLGIYSNLWENKFEFSIETYYKINKNIIEIKDGASLYFNKNTEQATLQGELTAYGIELMMKKTTGDLSGWFNYTYSNSTVLVDDPFVENRINYGEPYPSNYDKPHAINFVANYDLTRRVSFSGNLVYATGRPITYPTAFYLFNDIPTLSYSSRNAYRLPDYFRIDLSLNLEGSLLKRKIGHGTWAFSVYNVLGRKNAYSVYFNEEEGLIQAYKLSIFGAPIFSLTYNFKLGNYDSE